MTIDTIEKGIKETITHIQGMSKAFIYKDKSVGTFAGKGTYIRLEDIEKILPKDLRSFASNILSQAREEERKRCIRIAQDVWIKHHTDRCGTVLANYADDVVKAIKLSTLASERKV